MPSVKFARFWTEKSGATLHPLTLEQPLGDSFAEGMTLLQSYPIYAVGGIDIMLQAAYDLSRRREEEFKMRKNQSISLGTRLRVTMWRGFTNKLPSDDEDSDEDNDGDETEHPPSVAGDRLTSRLANAVWRKNPSNSSSPITSPSTSPPLIPSTIDPGPSLGSQAAPSQGPSSFRTFAEKLKDSDTVASLTKASTNWRARAL